MQADPPLRPPNRGKARTNGVCPHLRGPPAGVEVPETVVPAAGAGAAGAEPGVVAGPGAALGIGVERPPPGATGRSTTTLLIISPLRMRTAVFAFPMVRPHSGHVWTSRGPICFVDAFRASSAMAKLMSSRTTQPLTSPSWSSNHFVTSLALRSAKHFTGSGPVSSSRPVVVAEPQTRILFFSNMSVRASKSVSLRRHSDERTTIAPVRSMMWRRALTADGKKSDVSTRTAASPSTERMSKPPARAGRNTPSTSRKTTLLRSSGGKFVRLFAFSRTTASFILASFKTASDSKFGCGMLAYRLSTAAAASLAAFAAARSACCFFAASTLALMRCSRVSASFFCRAFSACSASRFACSRLSRASLSAFSRSAASRFSFSLLLSASALAISSRCFLRVSSLSSSLSTSVAFS
mmetsp:Transcript_7715/g.23467  ORF Transcript_7715/g.23467 Transcript_7715/m.23467 type:complete len:409 (+) Transcript_7715:60-1286(+)